MQIGDVRGYEVLDSRGNPTVQVEVILLDGSSGTAIVVSATSPGVNEATSQPRSLAGTGVCPCARLVSGRPLCSTFRFILHGKALVGLARCAGTVAPGFSPQPRRGALWEGGVRPKAWALGAARLRPRAPRLGVRPAATVRRRCCRHHVKRRPSRT